MIHALCCLKTARGGCSNLASAFSCACRFSIVFASCASAGGASEKVLLARVTMAHCLLAVALSAYTRMSLALHSRGRRPRARFNNFAAILHHHQQEIWRIVNVASYIRNRRQLLAAGRDGAADAHAEQPGTEEHCSHSMRFAGVVHRVRTV